MQAWNQKNLLEHDFPFKLWVSEGTMRFSHHWHEEVEIVYVIDGTLKVGLNNEIYTLESKDILLIGGGDVHYFLSNSDWSRKVLIQFGLSLFDNVTPSVSDRKFIRHLFSKSGKMSSDWDSRIHEGMEKQILALVDEYENKREGYRMALKARLYDLIVILLREIPTQDYFGSEKNKQVERLDRLENIFQYVEEHYNEDITLEKISKYAGFSAYHFTRFFKESTGITFGQYLRSFRITKAEWHLINSGESIAQVAYKSGFNSIKTFNRIFKDVTGRSPTDYRRDINTAINENKSSIPD